MEQTYESLITEYSLELNRALTTKELEFVQWLVERIND
ncbi:hypothetical protein M670_04049 [Schinkia azotoformans MEV2011]|uniref:Uncharacterized protein n=1 Tax=Schinkia azotoformans MEV2011 TaxID=1348973 RepID=A0A072NHR8_SCHAZ|nr:hypothetical protein M670_04049 [Schinkia azotoformans MEV2011]